MHHSIYILINLYTYIYIYIHTHWNHVVIWAFSRLCITGPLQLHIVSYNMFSQSFMGVPMVFGSSASQKRWKGRFPFSIFNGTLIHLHQELLWLHIPMGRVAEQPSFLAEVHFLANRCVTNSGGMHTHNGAVAPGAPLLCVVHLIQRHDLVLREMHWHALAVWDMVLVYGYLCSVFFCNTILI